MRWTVLGLVVVMLACASGGRQALESAAPLEQVALTVRVRNREGHPVPGAALVVWRATPSIPSRYGTTDAQGTLRLSRKPGRYVFQAQARGFVSSALTEVRLAPESEAGLDLTLTPSVPFWGQVVDTKGAPVEGAKLRLMPSSEPGLRLDLESDAQGRFVFEGVPEGPAVLRVEKEDWSLTRLEIKAPQQELAVVLKGLGSLRIQLRDPEGKPLHEERTHILPRDPYFQRGLSPERTGEFLTYRQLTAGRYQVLAVYSPSEECDWWRVVDVDVLAEQSTEVTVGFEGVREVGSLRGRAVDRDGRALGDSEVMAWMGGDHDEPGFHGTCKVPTASDGRFILPHVLERPRALSLNAQDKQNWESERAPLPGEDAQVVFQPSGGSLEGRVLGPDGRPVERFRLDGPPRDHPQGRYGLDAFFPQTYQWIIDADGFATALVRAEGRPNEARSVPDVILETGRTVQGRVLAEDGRTGVPSLELLLADPFELENRISDPARTAITDADGRFRFEHVTRRPQVLRADAKTQGTLLYELKADEASVDLRLAPLTSLSGVVTDGAQVPLARVDVNVRCEGWFDVSTSTEDTGRYAVRVPGDRECFVHLSDGAHEDDLRPHPPPLAFSPQRIQLPPNSRQSLDFEARQGPAALHLRFPGASEFLQVFLLPGTPPLPATTPDLEALMRSGFRADWTPTGEAPEAFDFSYLWFGRSDFVYSALPLGRYTLFITQSMNGGLHVLRVPVDLKDTGTRLITAGFPSKDGKATIFPR
ncbi:carboxypeptidase-like regulatory domain-containing protein [Corallococcus terminator]|uniref:Carboxypeptidase regulatory-like domain-containing protein n=1 Tax=Corallococcus terminator TaxID=2316733 RepID=A0A3A8IR89_9BACT|nr:carboxypeptidase-like regulatory domain-containing protein [Corallococcus terminator]RKG82280.1 carboxypeptidase regulatory-like domain-containing protein [Corallococcus terminator]